LAQVLRRFVRKLLLSSELLLVSKVLLPIEDLIDQLWVIVEEREGLVGAVEDVRYVLVNLLSDLKVLA
jgi:hypothetical protein